MVDLTPRHSGGSVPVGRPTFTVKSSGSESSICKLRVEGWHPQCWTTEIAEFEKVIGLGNLEDSGRLSKKSKSTEPSYRRSEERNHPPLVSMAMEEGKN